MALHKFLDHLKSHIIVSHDDGSIQAIPKSSPLYRQLVYGAPANEEFEIAAIAPIAITDYAQPNPTRDDVRVEAGRRILTRYPDWMQRNMIAEGVALAEVGPANRTTEQNARVVELNDVWTWVGAVRSASNTMEANPPVDFAADIHWPS